MHGANGYLIHQFLAPNTNQRTDELGRRAEGRIRFAVEVATAVAEAIGAGPVGLPDLARQPLQRHRRGRPGPGATYTALLDALDPLGLAYLHLVESPDRDLTLRLRKAWPARFILNPFTGPEPTGPDALALIEDGTADMIAFGGAVPRQPRPARPPARPAARSTPRTAATFYGGDHRGYTDYPKLA